MRIIIHDYAGHPFQVQLSRALARRGHEVFHLFAGYNQTPRGVLEKQIDDPESFMIQGLFIRKPLEKNKLLKRWLQEREYGFILADAVRAICPDIIITANSPLDSALSLMKTCEKMQLPVIYWLQDMLGLGTQRIMKNRFGKWGRVVGAHYMRVEQDLLRRCDHVVMITEDFEPYVRSYGVSINKMSVIHNWAPLHRIKVMEKQNSWAEEHHVERTLNILYTGTLGMKHNPNLLVALGEYFHNEPTIKILVVSEGKGREFIAQEAEKRGLNNIHLFDFQPFNRMSEVLASADILIGLLEPEASVFSVPSKVLTYLCASRPIVINCPSDNLAARMLVNHDMGIVVSTTEVSYWCQVVQSILVDQEMRRKLSRNAREYAERTFDIERITHRFEELINQQLT